MTHFTANHWTALGLVLTLTIAEAAPRERAYPRARDLKLELPLVPTAAIPAEWFARVELSDIDTPRIGLGAVPGIPPPWFKVCGFGAIALGEWLAREGETKEATRIELLARAFRECRKIDAWVFEPLVRVSDYPKGHFGDWVHEERLVLTKLSVVDATLMREIFTLLAEPMNDPRLMPDWEFFDHMEAESLEEFKSMHGFSADFLLQFVGVVPLRVEISVSDQIALIQAGAQWGICTLDRWGIAALRSLLATAAQHPDST